MRGNTILNEVNLLSFPFLFFSSHFIRIVLKRTNVFDTKENTTVRYDTIEGENRDTNDV